MKYTVKKLSDDLLNIGSQVNEASAGMKVLSLLSDEIIKEPLEDIGPGIRYLAELVSDDLSRIHGYFLYLARKILKEGVNP